MMTEASVLQNMACTQSSACSNSSTSTPLLFLVVFLTGIQQNEYGPWVGETSR